MKKTFDCVDLQDREAKRIRAETRHMTQAEELAYWAKRRSAISRRRTGAKPRASVVRESGSKYGRGG